MKWTVLMSCLVGMGMMFAMGADEAKPMKAPTSLPISLSINKPTELPLAGGDQNMEMTLVVKNNGEKPVKVSEYVPVDPVSAKIQRSETLATSNSAMIRVTCKLPENHGGFEIARQMSGAKDVTIEPKKSATLKFEIPSVILHWAGDYELKAEILNKNEFTCPASAPVTIEVKE